MDLLVEQGRVRLIPALILYHPSPLVVRRALQHFARVPAAPTSCPSPTASTPTATPRSARPRCGRGRAVQGRRRRCCAAAPSDESPLVRATALAGLIGHRQSHRRGPEALRAMFERREARRETTLAVARVIREEPSPVFADAAAPARRDARTGRTGALAAEAMGRIRDDRFLPALLPLLAQRQTRGPRPRGLPQPTGPRPPVPRRGPPGPLAAAGAAPTPAADPEPVPDRPGGPRPREASLLPEADGMVRFKILRALNRLGDHPEVELDPTILLSQAIVGHPAGRAAACSTGVSSSSAVSCSDPRRLTPGHELFVEPAAGQGGPRHRARVPPALAAPPRRGHEGHLSGACELQRQGAREQPRAAREPARAAPARRRAGPRGRRPARGAPAALPLPFYVGRPPVDYE